MYKVKNKLNDVRKFRDKRTGKTVFVEPNKYVLTNSPPKENSVWKVTIVEKVEKAKQKTEEEFNIDETEKKEKLN